MNRTYDSYLYSLAVNLEGDVEEFLNAEFCEALERGDLRLARFYSNVMDRVAELRFAAGE